MKEKIKQVHGFEEKWKTEEKVKAIQENHAQNVSDLAGKIEGLAEISNQHLQLVQRNAWLEQELA